MPVIGFLQLGPIASATVCDPLAGDLGYKQLTAQGIIQRPKNQCNAYAQRDIEAFIAGSVIGCTPVFSYASLV